MVCINYVMNLNDFTQINMLMHYLFNSCLKQLYKSNKMKYISYKGGCYVHGHNVYQGI